MKISRSAGCQPAFFPPTGTRAPNSWTRFSTCEIARVIVMLLCVTMLPISCGAPRRDTIVIGSKNFTEQAILGELLAQHLEAHTHLHVVRRFYLVGTYICQQALLAGRINTYVEYTGTALTAILKQPVVTNPSMVRRRSSREICQAFQFRRPSLRWASTTHSQW